jgi:hypothetical protein
MDAKNMTSIEWLVRQVNSDCLNSVYIRQELIDKAKEMYNQEITEAHIYGQLLYSCQSEKKKEI